MSTPANRVMIEIKCSNPECTKPLILEKRRYLKDKEWGKHEFRHYECRGKGYKRDKSAWW